MNKHEVKKSVTVNDPNLAKGKDLAKKYAATTSKASEVIPKELTDSDIKSIEEKGYIIIPDVLSTAEISHIKQEANRLLGPVGRNTFEGKYTQRLYASLEKTRAFDRLVDHPRIMAILDRIFSPNYLLSQCQVINILPGEASQALHPDDGFYRIARPRPELSAATIWAIDDFTETNGATRVIPHSHQWETDRVPQQTDDIFPAVMKAGSVLFYPGTFWHGGGANKSESARMAITCQYCQPYLRTQENFFLSISKDTVKAVSEDIKRMLGYSIHPPFMGMTNGMHPKRVLEG
ncbi:phytanoyl-CoA dioxygenase family protein [Microscilla marina]|uniref:Phytanoyl-CoA dioxygenase (PhyH) family n=1 Tax=Microscilla marina ATCC 23134 TaxID=313606 RepID=A1ZPP9_MICM2|nr:phytanoyl-CoA dioxygenase family protein [Microscilla marina]EAY27554.1 phytanoyl-CoA dioxygenase (PhyH) family [Microscilla marina ATCC 23134]